MSTSDYSQERIIRLPQVKAATGLGRTSIYEGMSNNTFPKSISLGPNSVGWIESEVSAWIAERIRISRTSSQN